METAVRRFAFLNYAILFAFLFAGIIGLGIFTACAPASAQGGPVGGAPGGWDDLRGRANDFTVAPIEGGLALLIDEHTGRAWILAGNPQSWQAIEPVGGL